jgi:DNA-binding transcriptional MerR regulator
MLDVDDCMTTKELAKKCGVSSERIKIYVRMGLLLPKSIIGLNYVFDRIKDYERVKKIRHFIKLGVKLDDIDLNKL